MVWHLRLPVPVRGSFVVSEVMVKDFKGSDKIEIRDKHLVIYLVWSFDADRRGFALESVSLTKKHARYAKACALNQDKRVLVEVRYAEHLIGGSLGLMSGEEPPEGYEGDDIG